MVKEIKRFCFALKGAFYESIGRRSFYNRYYFWFLVLYAIFSFLPVFLLSMDFYHPYAGYFFSFFRKLILVPAFVSIVIFKLLYGQGKRPTAARSGIFIVRYLEFFLLTSALPSLLLFIPIARLHNMFVFDQSTGALSNTLNFHEEYRFFILSLRACFIFVCLFLVTKLCLYLPSWMTGTPFSLRTAFFKTKGKFFKIVLFPASIVAFMALYSFLYSWIDLGVSRFARWLPGKIQSLPVEMSVFVSDIFLSIISSGIYLIFVGFMCAILLIPYRRIVLNSSWARVR